MANQRNIAEVMQDLGVRLALLQPGHLGSATNLATFERMQTALQELRAAQEELIGAREDAEAQRERYYDLFHFAPDGYLVTNTRGQITEANHAASELFNVPERFITGKPLLVYATTADNQILSRAIRHMRTHDRGEWTLRILPRNSDPRVVHITAAAVRDISGNVQSVRWLIRDVTEQRKAARQLRAKREQLRELTARLTLAEELERRRIAGEIHDHISQSLAVAKLRLGMLRETCSGEGLRSLDEVRELLSQVLAQTRSLSFELSPTMLYELGLGPAIEWLAEQRSGYGVKFRFQGDAPNLRLGRELEIALFQAVRELIANIIKHAQAHNSVIHLYHEGNHAIVEVIDDGIGFNLAELPARRAKDASLGLFSLQERMDHLGGSMEIETAPGRGTRVRLAVPVGRANLKSRNGKEPHDAKRTHRRRSSDPSPGTAVPAGKGAGSSCGGRGERRPGSARVA